jgi:hypothetical protein
MLHECRGLAGLVSAATRPNMMGSFVFSFFGLVLLDYISIFTYY